MDRKIVYPGAIPLETDLLQTNRFAMVGLAKLASAMMGSSTYLHGLECRPAQPASLHVTVAAGEIYSLQNVDGTAYSSLDADTHSILKQGILAGGVTLPLTAPNTAGFSVNYLVQVAYQDVDAESTVLPYYNASNPTQAWHGPNNSGSAQGTVRAGVCSVSIKAGVAATTGTQTTPGVDAGHVAAYVVAVKSGQTSITAADISVATNAPFLPTDGLVAGIQSGVMNYAPDHGHANTYAAEYSPPVTALVDGLKLTFKAKSANSGTSTFSPNGLAAAPIYSNVHVALKGGEILATGLVEVEWNSTLSAWVLVNTNLASISEGLVRTVNTHGPDASGNVKLGTAADADLGKDKLGQVLTVGNYGLQNALTALKDTNLDTLKTFGFYLISNAANAPLGDTSVWFLSVLSWDSKTSGDPYRVLQIADGYGTSGTMKNRSFRRTYSGTAAGWSAWVEFYSEAHKPAAVDINAADVRNNFAAKMGVARVITGTNKPTSPGVWSVENSTWTPYPYGTLYVTTNNADLSATPGNDKFIHYLFIAHGTGNKLFVATDVNGTSTRKDKGWPTAVSYGYLMPGEDMHAHPVIHALGDSGQECIWEFDTQGGGIHSKAGTFSTQEWVNTAVHTNELHVGPAKMAQDGNIWGTRWDGNGGWLWDAIMWQVQNIGQMSVNGTQWWAKINLNGGTLIVQGGYFEGQDAEVTERTPLNIAVPNHLLGVFITNKNFAQGYATYNPQVTTLTDDNAGFNFVHGKKERMMYWIAVGY
ncbi:Uncharacterised protein [Serratia proteamaculans]|uniref:hypothetical protein n=1 Tax=Serratia proteamaculans TaxID=28151 RepID=UPI002183CFEF|nr:hypothetical protein [Serratia proteamaculans]CAI2427938.1 Uncharacterised protein [Serratia proteamaculans]